MTPEMVESELWQIYNTKDKYKIERLFNALANECERNDVERAIDKAWEVDDE